MNIGTRLLVACSIASLVILPIARAQAPAVTGTASPQKQSSAFKKEEIEQLVAPIALYPDSLVAQILMASTYPLEVILAARWSKANPSVKGKELEDAMQKQNWDPSVKSLTAFPQVLAMLNDKLDMTQKLGDAFLAQQKEVLDAVQRLRAKADQTGNLKSTKEQTVSKEQEGGATIIKIEPADPQTVYVPVYDPAVVYGPWPYPAYPPYYYYPYYPYGWYPGTAWVGFAAGIIIGGALWGGCNWGGGGVYINHRNYNNFNRTNIGGDNNWRHNVDHRKGVGYRDQATRDKFGGQRPGVDSRDQFRGRAEQGRRDIARGSADGVKSGRTGVSDRASGAGDRGGASNRASVGAGAGDRSNFADRRGMSDRGGGFNGVGGNGGSTRDFSSRGTSSRGSVSAGGGRSSGFSGGGGGRGGGGGGGRGGRR
jgi:hypothetical protein